MTIQSNTLTIPPVVKMQVQAYIKESYTKAIIREGSVEAHIEFVSPYGGRPLFNSKTYQVLKLSNTEPSDVGAELSSKIAIPGYIAWPFSFITVVLYKSTGERCSETFSLSLSKKPLY